MEAPDVFTLVAAFQQLLESLPEELVHEVQGDTFRVADRMTDILSLIQERGDLSVQELCEGMVSRDYVVATFLAVLELCKLRLLRVSQIRMHGAIRLAAAVPGDTEQQYGEGGEEE